MYFRLIAFLSLILSFSGISQETESGGMMESYDKYLKFDTSTIHLDIDSNPDKLFKGLYNLENISSGLFLRPENFKFQAPTFKVFEIGHSLKYYIGNSDICILAGQQTIVSDRINGIRSYDIGLNAGLGYDISEKMQIEGRTFRSLFNTAPDDAYQPVQLTPLQPVSLGFKTTF